MMQASEILPTVKIKPAHKSQGDFVEINAEDFDPKIHTLADGKSAPAASDPTPAEEPAHKPRSKGAAKRKGGK
jgi:hypothetical protein